MAETSSDQITLTAEEVMELATYWYIDFPSVRVIDLEGPQYSEKGFKAAEERVSNAPTIKETLASVSKALQEYESADGFSSAAGAEAADVALVAPAGLAEPTVGASAQLAVDRGLEAPPLEPAEATDVPPLLQRPVHRRLLSERKHHHRPAWLLLMPRALRFVPPMSRPPSHKGRLLPRRRQEPPPRRSKRSMRREHHCLRA
jgi:hypothetical protein